MTLNRERLADDALLGEKRAKRGGEHPLLKVELEQCVTYRRHVELAVALTDVLQVGEILSVARCRPGLNESRGLFHRAAHEVLELGALLVIEIARGPADALPGRHAALDGHVSLTRYRSQP